MAGPTTTPTTGRNGGRRCSPARGHRRWVPHTPTGTMGTPATRAMRAAPRCPGWRASPPPTVPSGDIAASDPDRTTSATFSIASQSPRPRRSGTCRVTLRVQPTTPCSNSSDKAMNRTGRPALPSAIVVVGEQRAPPIGDLGAPADAQAERRAKGGPGGEAGGDPPRVPAAYARVARGFLLRIRPGSRLRHGLSRALVPREPDRRCACSRPSSARRRTGNRSNGATP